MPRPSVVPATVLAVLLALARWPGVLRGDDAPPAPAPAPVAAPPTPTITAFAVEGDVESPSAWTNARLREAFAKDLVEVTFDERGTPHRAMALPLARLVREARPRLATAPKHHDLAFAVLVVSRDGFTAAFSFAELDPALGKAQVFLALDHDAGPLGEAFTPASLLVPSDGKRSRWVRGVARIEVRDLLRAPASAAAAAPAPRDR